MKETNVKTQTLWHYTTLNCLFKIMASGFIKRATAGVLKGEKSAVWFSTNQEWENTCNKGILDHFHPLGVRIATKAEMITFGGGLARIGVDEVTAPHNWQQFRRLSKIAPQFAESLASVALKSGADPDEWRVSFKPIVKKHWTDVQIWNTETECWEPIWDEESDELPLTF